MTLRVLVSFIAGFSFMVVVSVGLWLGMRKTTISSTTTVKATSGGLITFASAKLEYLIKGGFFSSQPTTTTV